MSSINMGKTALFTVVGVSFLVITSSAMAKTSSSIKPGWGFGDANHLHVGPPGQSVIPHNGIVQVNNSVNNISVNTISNTGGNNVSNNRGSLTTIVTGSVSSVLTFVSSLGQNVFHFGS